MPVSSEQYEINFTPDKPSQGVLFDTLILSESVRLDPLSAPETPVNPDQLELAPVPEKLDNPQGRIFDGFKGSKIESDSAYEPTPEAVAFMPFNPEKELELYEEPVPFRPSRRSRKEMAKRMQAGSSEAQAQGLEGATWSWPVSFDSPEKAQTMSQALIYAKNLDKSQRNLWVTSREIEAHQKSDKFGTEEYEFTDDYNKAVASSDKSAVSKERLMTILPAEIAKIRGLEADHPALSRAVDRFLQEYAGLNKEQRAALKSQIDSEVKRLEAAKEKTAA